MAFGTYRINFEKVKDRPISDIFGTGDLKPSEMTKTLWNFIKANKLSKK